MSSYTCLEELSIFDSSKDSMQEFEEIKDQLMDNNFCYLINQRAIFGIILSPIVRDYLGIRKRLVQVACGKDYLYLGSNLDDEHFKCQTFNRHDLFCIFDVQLIKKMKELYEVDFESNTNFLIPVKFGLKTYLGEPVVTINVRAMEE